ncbi:ATP-binding protein [Streptomyces sp. NPDC035033]|uniref:sensor histidine kinase n=1 Tax=Streptomyces sp. NPDC035033 TaxID=3155368 RepID=UPI0033C0150F
MSFRLRVLALVLLVAAAATAATAWLTLREAAGQVRESAAADQRSLTRITEGLRAHGATHGTWDGVLPLVRSLAEETGQRIRVATEAGPVADSDALLGRAPRPGTTAPPFLVDPRPRLELPAGLSALGLAKTTATAVFRYGTGVTYAACLTRAGHTVTTTPGDLGVPDFADGGKAPGAPAGSASCVRDETAPTGVHQAEFAATEPCRNGPADALHACLRRVFAERTAAVAPQPLTVRLGAVDDAGRTLAVGPAVAVAAGVVLAALGCAVLLSRAVLRPVRALTTATRGLGEGDLGRRVPAAGRDEIGELGRAFNRMADSLAASEERQRRLVGDIAHELRTPLANLRGYLEALRDGVLEADPDLLDSLHEEVLLQQRIVDDLQDLALAEAGALTYHRRALDARELLDACRTAHSARAAAAGVELTVTGPGPGAVRLHGDPDRLRQALGNLVGNAVRHTPAGGSVRLELGRADGRVRIAVRDTGEGIPAADLPYLFDRFWRADAARGRATGGSGLGLSICRRIVADHGGTVTAASEPGKGSVFTVLFPGAPRAEGEGENGADF